MLNAQFSILNSQRSVGRGWIRTTELVRGQIYSLLPLATWLLAHRNRIYKSDLQSHLSESNQRPTDYKSVALPAELKWLINFSTHHAVFNQRPSRLQSGCSTNELKWRTFFQSANYLPFSRYLHGGRSNKELPPNFGKAKVREFDNWKNF